MAKRETLGQRLKRLLKEHGLSQTELATKVGIDRADLNRLVNDKRKPRGQELSWLAEFLDVSLDEFAQSFELSDDARQNVEDAVTTAKRIHAAERGRDEAVAKLEAVMREHADAQKARDAAEAELYEQMAQIKKKAAEALEALTKEDRHRRNQIALLRAEVMELKTKMALATAQLNVLKRRNALLERQNALLVTQNQALDQHRLQALQAAQSSGGMGLIVGGLAAAVATALLKNSGGDDGDDGDDDDDDE